MGKLMRTPVARPAGRAGRAGRMVSGGGFPAAPAPWWTPGQVARWQQVRDFAAAYPGNAAGGWTVESAGVRPGAVRMLACWAAAPVAGLGTLAGALHAGVPQTPAVLTATGVACWLVVQGARIAVRADAAAETRMRAQNAPQATPQATPQAAAQDGQDGQDAPAGSRALPGAQDTVPALSAALDAAAWGGAALDLEGAVVDGVVLVLQDGSRVIRLHGPAAPSHQTQNQDQRQDEGQDEGEEQGLAGEWVLQAAQAPLPARPYRRGGPGVSR